MKRPWILSIFVPKKVRENVKVLLGLSLVLGGPSWVNTAVETHAARATMRVCDASQLRATSGLEHVEELRRMRRDREREREPARSLATRGLRVELGRRWTILDSYLKPYACARWVHPALDATRLALAEARGGDDPPGMDPTEIERVDVETFAFAASLSATDVTSDMQARFSVPYSVAALIADGVLDAGSFLPDGLARRPVADLANRVHLSENPDMSAALPRERPATVTVQLRDGRRGTGRVRTARGNPDHPLTEAEVVTKFRGNVGDLLSATIVDDLVAALLAPDNTGATTHSVARLMAAVPLSGTIG